MKKINSIIVQLLICFIVLPFISFSQVKLNGNVKDKEGMLSFVNVILTDSNGEFKYGTISEENGSFELTIKPETYNVKVSFVGYKEWSRLMTIDADTSLGEIVLESETLDEVVVTFKKKLVDYKSDRIVYNVENNISVSGGDALGALKTAPGLMIQNNTISILGKGASRVMINERMVDLSGEELVNFLNSISASDIKNIEVMSNPPAKYEAAGSGGLININLKKGALNSWKNTTSLSYDQNKYNFYTLRNSFIYNKDKIKFMATLNGSKGNVNNKGDLDLYFPDGPWFVKGLEKQKKDAFSGRLSLDYTVSENTTVGVQYFGDYNNPDSNYTNSSTIFNQNMSLDSYLINEGFKDNQIKNHSLNAHSITKLDTLGTTLSFDVDYFNYKSKTDNNFEAKEYSPNSTFLGVTQAAQNNSNQDINNYSFKADVVHPLKKINLNYGAKASVIKSESAIQYYDLMSGTPVYDLNQSNQFEYEENNQAVYVDASKEFTKKLNLQLGLRLESTQTEGFSQTLNQLITTNYTKLFPTAYLSYTHNENNMFSINYGRRIERPSFSLLNPFRVYINSNSYSEGNPFIQPSIADNVDFTYNFKGKLITNAFLNYTSNGFGVVFNSNTATNTQIITRENYYDEYYFGVGQTYIQPINKWWESEHTGYLLGSETKFVNGLDATPKNSGQLFFSTNSTFSLGKTSKLRVEYVYSSPFKKGLYSFGYTAGLNVSFRQNFLNDKLSMSLLFNDVLNKAYLRDFTSTVNGVKQVYNENNSSRFFRVTLIYNFGNKKMEESQTNTGNEDEKQRAK